MKNCSGERTFQGLTCGGIREEVSVHRPSMPVPEKGGLES